MQDAATVRFDNAPCNPAIPPDAYPIVEDFTVEPIRSTEFGTQMRWTSPSLGILTTFEWWDHLERPRNRLTEDDWTRPWSGDEPFTDADMDWALEMWAYDEFVHVHSGLGFDELVYCRVPRRAFDAPIAASRTGVTL